MLKRLRNTKLYALVIYFLQTTRLKNTTATVYYVLKILIQKIIQFDIDVRAAAVAYNFTLAVFPTLIFLFSLIPYIPVENLDERILNLLSDVMPAGIYGEAKRTIVEIISKPRGGVLSLGFFFALYASTSGTMALMRAFNLTLTTQEKRGFVKARLIAVMMNFLLTMVLFVSIVVLIYSYWRKSKRNVKQLTILNNEISRQKDKLQEAFTKLGLSDKEKDTILRAVAHDLRNPVVGISSLTKLMILEDEDHVNIDKLKLIDGACSNALHLIDDIIEAAENKEGLDITLKKKKQNLMEIVKNAITLLKYRADEKKQTINLEADIQNLEINIYGQKIGRVVGNLISNAIKFSETGKEIKITVVKNKKEVLVSVSDKGIGIPDKIGKDVFQLFTPSKRFGTKGEKSYGLGLSICKQIITAHEGEIWYENNPAGGTTFCFTLPL